MTAAAELALPRVYAGAVIGLGGIARQSHLPALTAAPRLHVRAAVDTDPAARAPAGVALVGTLRELDGIGGIDFVDICTPTASHLPLTLAALERGYHVVCEKPVALDRAQAIRIRDAARGAGRIVMPCHQYRHNPAWARVKQWLHAGAIGRWHLCELRVHRPGADPGAAATHAGPPWRVRAGESCGGVLLDHGTHLLYQLLDAGGLPDAVQGWTGRLRHDGYEVEDTAQLTFHYPGRLATVLLTWAGRARENHVRFVGERGEIEWTGGILRLDADGGSVREDFSAALQKSAYASWFTGLFDDFVSALDAGEGGGFMADVADVALMLESAYHAAATGCMVPITRPR